MTRRRLGTRRALFKGSASAARLPNPVNGPFETSTAPLISTLSDLDLHDGAIHGYNTTQSSPLIANRISIRNIGTTLWGNGRTLWIWCNEIYVQSGSGLVSTARSGLPYSPNGTNGDPSFGCIGMAGNGGDGGGSGGGGGSVSTDGSFQSGGSGSDGGFGQDGNNDGLACYFGGVGGQGFGSADFASSGATFFASLGAGGHSGENYVPTGPWGFSGGGTSTDGGGCVGPAYGGGGGSGGAPIILCCNKILGTAYNINAAFSCGAQGGDAGQTNGSFCCAGGLITTMAFGGGGASFNIFAKQNLTSWPSGNFGTDPGANEDFTTTGSSGQVKWFEINNAGTLIIATSTDPTHTFNNIT